MTVNPQVAAMLAAMADMPAPDMATLTADTLRAANDQPMAFGEPPAVARVKDIHIPLAGRTLEARLYIPQGQASPPPLTMFYHGGGWVIGTLDTHDATCRVLAGASGSAILSLAYRLAPEHRYPAAVDDCYDALVWAEANAGSLGVDASRLAVAGDSAGGNLAAAAALLARDRGGPMLRHQLLIYPVTDADFTTASYLDNGSGKYFLAGPMMQWFWEQYLGDTPADQAPLAAILRGSDLSGLPPATVITAQYDPLRDEGMAYARQLQAAGVETDAQIAPGMIHGFMSMFQAVPDAVAWIEHGGTRLAKALA